MALVSLRNKCAADSRKAYVSRQMGADSLNRFGFEPDQSSDQPFAAVCGRLARPLLKELDWSALGVKSDASL